MSISTEPLKSQQIYSELQEIAQELDEQDKLIEALEAYQQKNSDMIDKLKHIHTQRDKQISSMEASLSNLEKSVDLIEEIVAEKYKRHQTDCVIQ